MITFTVKKELACYAVGFADTIVKVAIAKACMDVEEMEDEVDITLEEDQVVSIFQRLTTLPEGISATLNNQLHDVLLPLLGDYPVLAEKITAIMTNNYIQRQDLIDRGLAIITRVQEAINNN